MGPLLSWMLPFWAVTFVILLSAVLISRIASNVWGESGLFVVFGSFWIALLVGIPALSASGPPVTWRTILGLGLFLSIVLAMVALPLHSLGATATFKTFLLKGSLAALISTLLSPVIFLISAGIGGDSL